MSSGGGATRRKKHNKNASLSESPAENSVENSSSFEATGGAVNGSYRRVLADPVERP